MVPVSAGINGMPVVLIWPGSPADPDPGRRGRAMAVAFLSLGFASLPPALIALINT